MWHQSCSGSPLRLDRDDLSVVPSILVQTTMKPRSLHSRPHAGLRHTAVRRFRLLCAGQAVLVRHGALAGMRGTLQHVTRRNRWIVRLDEAPPGVLLEIDSALLVPCDYTGAKGS